MKVNWINEKERLEELIKQKNTYEEIGRKYGVTGAAVKKAAKRLGITIEYRREINPNEHFNRGKGKVNYCLNCGKTIKLNRKFCDTKCQQEYIFKEYIKSWKDGKINGLSGEYKDKDVDELFKILDLDIDGNITIDEFINAWKFQ